MPLSAVQRPQPPAYPHRPPGAPQAPCCLPKGVRRVPPAGQVPPAGLTSTWAMPAVARSSSPSCSIIRRSVMAATQAPSFWLCMAAAEVWPEGRGSGCRWRPLERGLRPSPSVPTAYRLSRRRCGSRLTSSSRWRDRPYQRTFDGQRVSLACRRSWSWNTSAVETGQLAVLLTVVLLALVA